MEAKFCLGVRMYLVYESLDHHPRIWIVASLMPRDAAVVAALIRKEWREGSTPACCSACLTLAIKFCRDNGFPFPSRNKGPSSIPLMDKYRNMATANSMCDRQTDQLLSLSGHFSMI